MKSILWVPELFFPGYKEGVDQSNLLTPACVSTDKCGLCRNFLLTGNIYYRLVTGVGKRICLLQ